MHKVTLVTQSEVDTAERDILNAIQTVVNEHAGVNIIGDTVEEVMEGFEAFAFNRTETDPVIYRITVTRHDGPSVG